LYSWVADATAGTKIRADRHDDEDNNLASGLSQCIVKDGQTTITQNIPFNSKRITALADPINPQDAATKAYADTKLALDGSTPLTGDVVIKQNDPALTLDGQPGFKNSIFGQKADKNRWEIVLGNLTAEGGSDAGSDFELINYHDDGSLIGDVLAGSRATGLLTVKANPAAALGVATKQYVDTTAANAAASKLPLAGGTLTGALVTAVGGNIASASLAGTLQIMGGANAAIGFYAPGYFAANFGLGSDGNFYMGGSSHGASTSYKFWTTRDFAVAPGANLVSNVRLVYAGDVGTGSMGGPGSMKEPYAGAVMTGFDIIIEPGPAWVVPVMFRWRYLQMYTNGWYTVGYA
jgi:hypothetical protein